MVQKQVPPIQSILGDLSEVSTEYIKQISNIKRVLERWVADPKFASAFEEHPEVALATLGLDVQAEEILPLLIPEEAKLVNKALKTGDMSQFPLSTLRYRAFSLEKLNHRKSIKKGGAFTNPNLAKWRKRQINRCATELGMTKAEAIVHAPLSIEISKGCTVGCWFCGVQAPKFDHNWPYTAENAALWKDMLVRLKQQLGDCIEHGFIYWATDPLDNPDYEKFIHDFWKITGTCPQTTTALGVKDVERTRRLLDFTRTLDEHVDRFSVLSLRMLQKIHDSFTPEELIRVECIPQNREAKDRYLKSMSGRARKYKEKKAAELTDGNQGDTIACVSGFLLNMIDKNVKLITPCQTTDKWPLGYWVLAEASFESPAHLERIIDDMIQNHIKVELELDDVVKLRKDLTWEVKGDKFLLKSKHLSISYPFHKHPSSLMQLLQEGYTQMEIAAIRARQDDVPMEETFFLLNELFLNGFIDEEPTPAGALAYELPLVEAAVV